MPKRVDRYRKVVGLTLLPDIRIGRFGFGIKPPFTNKTASNHNRIPARTVFRRVVRIAISSKRLGHVHFTRVVLIQFSVITANRFWEPLTRFALMNIRVHAFAPNSPVLLSVSYRLVRVIVSFRHVELRAPILGFNIHSFDT